MNHAAARSFPFSRHAEWEMLRLAIPAAVVRSVLSSPEQRLADQSRTSRWIYQSRVAFNDGKMYLVRVVVDELELPPLVVTVYRTSKIEKYWSAQ